MMHLSCLRIVCQQSRTDRGDGYAERSGQVAGDPHVLQPKISARGMGDFFSSWLGDFWEDSSVMLDD